MDKIALRPARPDDLDAVCALLNRSEQHDGLPRVMLIDEFRENLDQPYIDLAADARVALRGDTLAGFEYVWNPPVEAGDDRAYLFGEVDPEHRGHGVSRELLTWGVERATERLRSHQHGLPRYIRVDAFEGIDSNHRLYARLGFEQVRWFDELVRPLTDLPAVPALADVELLPWPHDRDEEIRQARNAAFADHWGTSPMPASSWHTTVRGHGARPDLSVVAVDRASGGVVACSINHADPEDDELTGRQEAWVHNLGTVRQWRGRGLASAMIAWSLAAFAAQGFSHAMIGVDGESPTGAARLYRNLGFTSERRSITHQIEVP